MRTIKESILSSTNTGKEGKIKEWCEKNIGSQRSYVINNGLIERANDWLPISVITDEDIPSYIKFGYLNGDFYIGKSINSMSKEQLPNSMNRLVLRSDTDILEPVEVNTRNGLFIIMNRSKEAFKNGIKKLKINITEPTNSDYYANNKEVNFTETKLRYKDLKNIEIIGDNIKVYFDYTPAARKLKTLYKHTYSGNIDAFLDNELPNFKKCCNMIHSDNYTFEKYDWGWVSYHTPRR
jgi:hypothetical protein